MKGFMSLTVLYNSSLSKALKAGTQMGQKYLEAGTDAGHEGVLLTGLAQSVFLQNPGLQAQGWHHPL